MTNLDTLDPCRAEALRIIAARDGNLVTLENDAANIARTINKGDYPNEEAGDFLYDRHATLQWAIAEAQPLTHQDMAVKVRLWKRSVEDGRAVWDGRLAETLLDALTG